MTMYELDPLSVVVVNDFPEMLDLMSRLLNRLGYRAVGITSAAMPQAHIQAIQPAVVILDVHLNCDGMQLVRQLRSDTTTAAIPIIVCSGDYPLLRELSQQLHGSGCIVITKPFTKDEVEIALKMALSTTSYS